MTQSEQINELATALAKSQAQFGSVPKTKTARIPTKAGGEYSYNYSDLADILDMVRKPLAENGLSIMQMPNSASGVCEIYTQLSHNSGQWIGSTISYPISAGDIKLLGTAITYLRRYALSAMLGLASDDDDDGTGTTGGHMERRQSQAARQQNGAPATNGRTPGPGPASEKQIKMLFAIWHKGGFEGMLQDWVADGYKCKVDELTKAQASDAIETLEKPAVEMTNEDYPD